LNDIYAKHSALVEAVAMDAQTMPHNKPTDTDLLVETDSRILDMVRKELSQEYLRLVTRAIQARAQPGDAMLPAAP
jgi:hypothetical protein